MGLVNTVVPLERLEEETVAVVPRDARPLPLRAAAGQGELQRRTRTASPASSSSRTTPTCSSTPATRRKEGREAYKEKRAPGLLAVPAAAVSAGRPTALPLRIWLMAARPRTLPAGVAPVLVGTALAIDRGHVPAPARSSRRCSARSSSRSARTSPTTTPTRAAAPTPRTASGPVRVTAGGLVPPEQVLIATYVRVRPRGPVRHLPDRRSPAGCCWPSAPRRSSPACSTPAARGPTATRASARSSSSCSSASSPSTGSYYVQVERLEWEALRARGARSGCSPRRSSSSTTSATRRPTRASASARSRCASAARGARDLYAAMIYVAFLIAAGRRGWPATRVGPWVLLPLAGAAARRAARADRAPARPTARRSTARWPGPAMLQLAFCVLLSAGLLLS